MVEDAAAAIEAARRAGMKSIGVSRQGDLDADVVVAALNDLPDDVFDALLGDSHEQ